MLITYQLINLAAPVLSDHVLILVLPLLVLGRVVDCFVLVLRPLGHC